MNSATNTATEEASHYTISEGSPLGIDLLFSEAAESEQADEGEQVDASEQADEGEPADNHKDRHNSRYSLQARVNAPRRFD